VIPIPYSNIGLESSTFVRRRANPTKKQTPIEIQIYRARHGPKMMFLRIIVSVIRQYQRWGAYTLWRHLSSAKTRLHASSFRFAGKNVPIAVTVGLLADVGVAQASLASNVRGVAGPHQGGEKGGDCKLELHFGG
jgi:hypothetical protein